MFSRGSELYNTFIAIDKIKRYAAGLRCGDDLLHDEPSWDATIRKLEIIGEATKTLLHNGVLDHKRYRRIVDFRNQINHGYFGIDEDVVWYVVTNKISEYENDLSQVVITLQLDMLGAIEIFKRENTKQTQVLFFLERLENHYK